MNTEDIVMNMMSRGWLDSAVSRCGPGQMLVFVIMTWSFFHVSASSPEPCDVAQNKCTHRTGCSMALHNYFMICGDLIHGYTNDCSLACQKSIISLLSTQDREGKNFMTCDCEGNEFCNLQKSRLNVCTSAVMRAMRSVSDDNTDISCSLAELICEADTPCLTALEYYQINCVKMLRGQRCTRRCNNSLSILYDLPKARKLRTCICDGTEEYDCMKVRRNTHNLCFNHQCRHGQCRSREGRSSARPQLAFTSTATWWTPASNVRPLVASRVLLSLTFLWTVDTLSSR